MRLSFVSITPQTPVNECPAGYVDEDTGEFWFQGETVTDPAALAEVAAHSPIGANESIRHRRCSLSPDGAGAVPRSFIEMMQSCTVSAVHLEMRDAYTQQDPDYLRWPGGERFDGAQRWPEWIELVSGLVARGVLVRRGRIVSEPVSGFPPTFRTAEPLRGVPQPTVSRVLRCSRSNHIAIDRL